MRRAKIHKSHRRSFFGRPGPPTHGSLFKPPPILYSSVRGGLLTQPDSAHKTKPGPGSRTEEGRHALALWTHMAGTGGCCCLWRCYGSWCERELGPPQGDICVTIQTVRPRVSAVTQARPHAVRWDEGVRYRSLARAHNKHVAL